jgi:putative colanic acid biosynthesis acetyltransferase WcaF
MKNSLVLCNLSLKNRILRALWGGVWLLFYRTSPTTFHFWRRSLLRCFGAKIGRGAHPYPSVQIWAPWNLEMGENSCLSHHVICYNVAPVYVGNKATVSQYSHLCTATRDYNDLSMPLMVAPIRIEDCAWVTTDVFVGPGITIGQGAVVSARSSVFSDVSPWTIARGNPAKSYRSRIVNKIEK